MEEANAAAGQIDWKSLLSQPFYISKRDEERLTSGDKVKREARDDEVPETVFTYRCGIQGWVTACNAVAQPCVQTGARYQRLSTERKKEISSFFVH